MARESFLPDEGAGGDGARVRALLEVSGTMAHGDPDGIREALGRAAKHASASEIEETILQAYLFLGYPAALNTFALWRDITAGDAGRDSEGDSLPTPDDPWGWEARGEAVCRVVYGGQYERLRANVRRLHPDMEHWMVVEGYGKVLGRPGLDLKVRELCIVVILAVQGAPRQLYSHLRGALHAGAHDDEIEGALSVAREWQSEDSAESVREVWSAVRGRGR
jgi:4-carboxymuconolactone decarboxylase